MTKQKNPVGRPCEEVKKPFTIRLPISLIADIDEWSKKEAGNKTQKTISLWREFLANKK